MPQRLMVMNRIGQPRRDQRVLPQADEMLDHQRDHQNAQSRDDVTDRFPPRFLSLGEGSKFDF